MENINVTRAMETSDLPKLSKRFEGENSFFKIAWNVYKQRLDWGYQKINLKNVKKTLDDPNPLITLFTWSVMVPVGGTFCCKV
jgi:hypothetical protein